MGVGKKERESGEVACWYRWNRRIGQWMAQLGAARKSEQTREEKREREKVKWLSWYFIYLFYIQVSKNHWIEIPTHIS